MPKSWMDRFAGRVGVMTLAQALVCAGTVAALSGCGAAPLEDGEDDEIGEVGQLGQALGESACGTTGGYPYGGGATNGTTRQVPLMQCGWSLVLATSPNRTYTNAGCPNQFVQEIRGPLHDVVNLGAEAYGVPQNSAACLATRVDLGAYARSAAGAWSLAGRTRLKGVWNGGTCAFVPRPGYTNLQLGISAGRGAVRLVGRAYRLIPQGGVTIQSQERVQLAISYGGGPC